jgi:streptogramin lyase
MPPTRPAATTTTTTVTPPTTPTTTTTVGALATIAPATDGSSYGGKQAIIGAHIYLYAANTEDWGKPSISLLDPSVTGVSTDVDGAYVTSNSNGNFSFTGRYSCQPGQQVYVYAKNGNPGHTNGTVNEVIGLMSIFGTCPSSGNFAGTISFFSINEVTTVATAYALSGFMLDPTHVSSGYSANARYGMAGAFAAYNNLVDLEDGTAKAYNDEGNGFIPQAKINALANLLVPCVNSIATSTACNTLFTATKASYANAAPANTAAAVLAMAHNPSLNVATLYGIAAANAPYQPTLTAAPRDWTLALTFFSDNMPGPYYPAVDSKGYLWVPSYAGSNVIQFDPLGNIAGTWNAGGTVNQPFAVAVDSSDNAWVVNYIPGGATISRMKSDGTPLGTAIACGAYCFFPAFDSTGNLWVSGMSKTGVFDASGNSKTSFANDSFSSGIALAANGSAWTLGNGGGLYHFTLPSTSTRLTQPLTATDGNDITPIAMDANENIWFVSGRNSKLGKADPNGALLSPAAGYTGGGLNSPAGLAIDGSGRVWVANRGNSSVSVFGSDGTALSPSTGLGTDSYVDQGDVQVGIHGPRGIVVDNAGNVWVANFTYNSITELIGAATPVGTPLSSAKHGQRP